MLFSSIKEMNRLISKVMTNIHLNLNLLSLKSLSPGQFWRAPIQSGLIEFSKFLLQLKSQRSPSETVCGFSICAFLILKGIMMF